MSKAFAGVAFAALFWAGATGPVRAAEPVASGPIPAVTPTTNPGASGVVGDVDENALERKKDAAAATIANDPQPTSKEGVKRQDKAKAVQTGNDAKLRDLPSPAKQGSE